MFKGFEVVNKQGRKLKKLLKDKTSCTIQHNGWCCGTCFFTISQELDNTDWRSLLLYRGDYNKEQIILPSEVVKESLNKIYKLCRGGKDETNKKPDL